MKYCFQSFVDVWISKPAASFHKPSCTTSLNHNRHRPSRYNGHYIDRLTDGMNKFSHLVNRILENPKEIDISKVGPGAAEVLCLENAKIKLVY